MTGLKIKSELRFLTVLFLTLLSCIGWAKNNEIRQLDIRSSKSSLSQVFKDIREATYGEVDFSLSYPFKSDQDIGIQLNGKDSIRYQDKLWLPRIPRYFIPLITVEEDRSLVIRNHALNDMKTIFNHFAVVVFLDPWRVSLGSTLTRIHYPTYYDK